MGEGIGGPWTLWVLRDRPPVQLSYSLMVPCLWCFCLLVPGNHIWYTHSLTPGKGCCCTIHSVAEKFRKGAWSRIWTMGYSGTLPSIGDGSKVRRRESTSRLPSENVVRPIRTPKHPGNDDTLKWAKGGVGGW